MSAKNTINSKLLSYLLLLSVLIGLTTANSCSLQLQEQTGETRLPVSGLWRSVIDNPDHMQFLSITSPGKDDYPYAFEILDLYRRNLLISGRRIFLERRSGLITTSANELLLLELQFTSGYYDVGGGDPVDWTLDQYSRLNVDLKYEKTDKLDLLRLSDDGNQLLGSDFEFERIQLRGLKHPIATSEVGLVIDTYKNSTGFQYVTFNQALNIEKAARKLLQVDSKSKAIKITKVYEQFGEASATGVKMGDVVVMPKYIPSQKVERARLTRAEVLRRIQKGQYVPKEDLIRVLGKQK
jgi:hypothetical protein